MTRRVIAMCGVMLFGLAADREAIAQMFGQRTTGRPLTMQEGRSQFESAGTLKGNERFFRRNRRPTDFVGPDVREMQGFVGSVQARATGRVTPTTEGLRRRVDRSTSINQPLTVAPRGRPHNPRVSISFSLPAVNESWLEDNVLNLLANSPQMSGSSRIAVSVEGRTAILRGEVLGVNDRDLAEILVSFEPGISSIRNELVVNPQLRRAPDSLAARREKTARQQAWVTLPRVDSPASMEASTNR